MKRICVFLSSKSNLPAGFQKAAEEVGAWIGQTGRTLVYGGSNRGLMEVLAQSAKKAGAQVIGVVPEILEERRWVSDTLDVTFHTADLDDRKATMIRESDVFVALPGGIGTLDEVFTILGANIIGLQKKRVVLYNVNGCWNQLIELLKGLSEAGLVSQELEKLIDIATNTDELEKICS